MKRPNEELEKQILKDLENLVPFIEQNVWYIENKKLKECLKSFVRAYANDDPDTIRVYYEAEKLVDMVGYLHEKHEQSRTPTKETN